MAEKIITKIQFKRGTSHPGTTLDVGEPGFDTQNKKIYVGDGVGQQPIEIAKKSDIPENVTLPEFKTINGQPIVGTGNIEIESGDLPEFKTINGQSIIGSGDIPIPAIPTFKTINGQQITGSGDITILSSIKKHIDKNVNFVGMSIWANDNRDRGNGLLRGYQTLLKEQFTFESTNDYVYSGNSLGGTSDSDGSSIMIQANGWSVSSNAIWTLDTITNDHARNIELGTIGDYNNATGITTYYGALRAFKDKVEQLSGTDAIVICANAVPRNAWGGYDNANTAGVTPKQYEYALMEVCSLNDWYFVNQYQEGACVPNVGLCTYDGIHLNNMGYRLAVKPWVEQFDIIANILSNAIDPEEPIDPEVTYTLTISPTPSTATVTLNGTVRKSITVTSGTSVTWSVSADGYVAQSGTEIVASNITKDITLAVEESGGDDDGVTYLESTYIKSNGVPGPANGYTSTDFVSVTTGEQWHYVGTTLASSAISVAGYDTNQVFVIAVLGAVDHSTGTDFTIPEDIAYIRACGKTNTGVNMTLSKVSN